MKLLNDIVDLLSDKAGSLTDAMLKTKVLMHKIGHKELAEWVSDELNGYGPDKIVPEYRVISIRLFGNVSNIAVRQTHTPLPTSHLSDKQRLVVTEKKLRESIQVLERYAASDNSLIAQVKPEWFPAIKKGGIEKSFQIEQAWTQFEPGQVVGVLIEVRSRLLDFVLNLQDELGDIPEDEMKDAAKGVNAEAMFNAAVFGDNTTVIVGHNNATTITNTVTKGDFNSLADTLKKAGVDEADVAELQAAVNDDNPATVTETKQFGPKVKEWMGKMTQKAIGGAWTIGLAAGGKLLADAVGGYYGIGS
ncbi:hypothetical protein PQQ75_04125 [Paraburkholderia aspalathi]|uniref:AbiTii domain-containing protein n=1 Tax=Paraburkholderia aspalathi TaxID=1324617 RepID=UPI0038BA9BFD